MSKELDKFQELLAIPAPKDAIYGAGFPFTGKAIDMYTKVSKEHPGDIIISWGVLYVQMWDWLMRYQQLDIPVSFPPPLYIDNGPAPVATESNTTVAGFMAHSWFDTRNMEDKLIAAPIFQQLRIYSRPIQDDIRYLAGKKPTPCVILAVACKYLFHELSHHIRAFSAWEKVYTSGDEDTAMCKLLTHCNNAGDEDDERETDRLALKLFNHFAFGRHDLGIITTGPFADFMRKRDQYFAEALDVFRFYELTFETYYNGVSEDSIQGELSAIVQRIRKTCKKNGKPYHFVK